MLAGLWPLPWLRGQQVARLWRRFKWFCAPTAIGIVLLAGWFIPTDDFLILPGATVNTTKLVNIPSDVPASHRGNLFLVTVYSAPANRDEWVFGHVYPHARLAPASTQLPPNTSYDAFQHIQERMMVDSQTTAKVVALEQLGYVVPARGEGVIVQQVASDSPAAAAGLVRGDVVTAIDDRTVGTVQELLDTMKSVTPGASLRLSIKTPIDSRDRQLAVVVGHRPENPAAAYLGVGIGTYKPSFDFPVQIDIDSRGIIGPSAGLVLTLAIIQRLSPNDITHDHNVAATGTITLQGDVGPVGDVQEKVLAAEGKADVFLVPRQDYEEARKVLTSMRVVQVSNVQEALHFLNTLD